LPTPVFARPKLVTSHKSLLMAVGCICFSTQTALAGGATNSDLRERKNFSPDTYPETSLAEAREKHAAARKQLQAGIDPGAHRKAEKVSGVERAANSFAVIAEEWLAKQTGKMSPATYEKARWTFDTLVNPWIGSRPIADIDAPEMLKLQRIEERGAHETAHR